MKQCPKCGRKAAAYATKCKYCDARLPESSESMRQPQLQAIKCPSCGGPVNYSGGSQISKCAYCGCSMIIPGKITSQDKPEAQLPAEPTTLSSQVEKIVQGGNSATAIKLLRDQAFLRLQEAERVVEIITTGEYGDLAALILSAQKGKIN